MLDKIRNHPLVLNALIPIGAMLAAFLLGAVLIILLGADPLRAYAELLGGALGDVSGLTQSVVKATPLLLVGLGIVIAFRANVINIGGEGQIIAGDHGVGQFLFMEDGLATGRTPDEIDAELTTGLEIDLLARILKTADGDCRRSPAVETKGRGRGFPDGSPENRLIDSHVLRGIGPPEGEKSPDVHRFFSRPPFPGSRSPDILVYPGDLPVPPDHPCPR